MARKKRELKSAEPPFAAGGKALPRGGSTVPGAPDVCAKNSGHGKKTADKWNQ
jgi:hypothetical protein